MDIDNFFEQKEYHYSIPGNPITKKNSQRIIRIKGKDGTVRTLVKPSKQFEGYELSALYFLQPIPARPIDYPVNCRYVYYMAAKRKVDALNLCAATDDILVSAGILKDDNRDIVAGHDGTRVYYDKGSPRVDITITPVDGYRQWRGEREEAVEPAKKRKKKAVRVKAKKLPKNPDFDEEHWD